MNIRLNFLFILFFSSCGVQQSSSQEWKRIGIATIEKPKMQVVLGTTYNIIETAQAGKIHLKHKYIDSMAVSKTGDGHFKATFRKAQGLSIELKSLKMNGQIASSDFKINLKGSSFPETSVKIKIDNGSFSNNKTEVIKSYFLPVIHDYLAKLLFKVQPNSCLDKALKLCGKGKIKSIDIGLFGVGCSMACQ